MDSPWLLLLLGVSPLFFMLGVIMLTYGNDDMERLADEYEREVMAKKGEPR